MKHNIICRKTLNIVGQSRPNFAYDAEGVGIA